MRLQIFLTLLCAVGAKTVIAVMGATGAQGGGVVDAILKDGTFACRAITRNVTSAAARELADRGCDVVAGDAEKPETLKQAFKGAEGAFLMSNVGPEEYTQAIGAADAAYEAGVKHIVWSTLDDVDRNDNFRNVIPKLGDSKIHHFSSKARASNYMRSKFYPVTHLTLPMFMENFHKFRMLSRVDDSHYEIVLPTTGPSVKFAMVSMRDVGVAVVNALRDPASSVNQELKLMGDMRTPKEMGALLEQHLGIQVTVKQPTPAQFAEFGFPFAREMANMFLYVSEYQDLFTTFQRIEDYQTFETYLQQNSQALKEYIDITNKAQGKRQDL